MNTKNVVRESLIKTMISNVSAMLSNGKDVMIENDIFDIAATIESNNRICVTSQSNEKTGEYEYFTTKEYGEAARAVVHRFYSTDVSKSSGIGLSYEAFTARLDDIIPGIDSQPSASSIHFDYVSKVDTQDTDDYAFDHCTHCGAECKECTCDGGTGSDHY